MRKYAKLTVKRQILVAYSNFLWEDRSYFVYRRGIFVAYRNKPPSFALFY